MSDEDDLAALGAALPKLDVDETSAQMIARTARASVGKPSKKRLVLPIVAAVVIVACLAWMIAKLLEARG